MSIRLKWANGNYHVALQWTSACFCLGIATLILFGISFSVLFFWKMWRSRYLLDDEEFLNTYGFQIRNLWWLFWIGRWQIPTFFDCLASFVTVVHGHWILADSYVGTRGNIWSSDLELKIEMQLQVAVSSFSLPKDSLTN